MPELTPPSLEALALKYTIHNQRIDEEMAQSDKENVNRLTRRSMLGGVFALAGCASSPRLVPASQAVASELSAIRFDAGSDFETWSRHLVVERMQGDPTVLALSSGGEDGAFGAGVLAGWSQEGSRPEFDVVTGVSAGALIAPFAFLGPSHDHISAKIYTEMPADHLIRSKGVFGLATDSLMDTSGMRAALLSLFDSTLLMRISEKYDRGGRLFVVTSNLDTARPTVWNMGVIAQQGNSQLFTDVIMASSSLPGIFPPVDIDLRTSEGGVRETHVDGGVNMQLLAVPDAAFLRVDEMVRPRGRLFVLVNNTLFPQPEPIARLALPILQQSLTTMVRSNAGEALDSAERFARRTQMTYRVAMIERDFDTPFDHNERFSPDYMSSLYQYGYDRGLLGTAWR